MQISPKPPVQADTQPSLAAALDTLHRAAVTPDVAAALAVVDIHLQRRTDALEDVADHILAEAMKGNDRAIRLCLTAGRALCDEWQTGSLPAT